MYSLDTQLKIEVKYRTSKDDREMSITFFDLEPAFNFLDELVRQRERKKLEWVSLPRTKFIWLTKSRVKARGN